MPSSGTGTVSVFDVSLLVRQCYSMCYCYLDGTWHAPDRPTYVVVVL